MVCEFASNTGCAFVFVCDCDLTYCGFHLIYSSPINGFDSGVRFFFVFGQNFVPTTQQQMCQQNGSEEGRGEIRAFCTLFVFFFT